MNRKLSNNFLMFGFLTKIVFSLGKKIGAGGFGQVSKRIINLKRKERLFNPIETRSRIMDTNLSQSVSKILVQKNLIFAIQLQYNTIQLETNSKVWPCLFLQRLFSSNIVLFFMKCLPISSLQFDSTKVCP